MTWLCFNKARVCVWTVSKLPEHSAFVCHIWVYCSNLLSWKSEEHTLNGSKELKHFWWQLADKWLVSVHEKGVVFSMLPCALIESIRLFVEPQNLSSIVNLLHAHALAGHVNLPGAVRWTSKGCPEVWGFQSHKCTEVWGQKQFCSTLVRSQPLTCLYYVRTCI